MNKITTLLFFFVCSFFSPFLLSIYAQQTNHVSISFSKEVGSEFRLLLQGNNEGEVELRWGNGSIDKYPLKATETTKIFGTIRSKELSVYGEVSLLECSGNEISQLNVSQMPSLEDLVCRKNDIATLDLTHNSQLRFLMLQEAPSLSELDLSQNVLLDSVICSNNPRIHTFLLPPNSQLKKLVLEGCARITSLDLSATPSLEHLDVNQVALRELDLTHNPNLIYLFAGRNTDAILTSLKLPNPCALQTILLPTVGLSELDLRGCKDLEIIATNYSPNLAKLHIEGLTEISIIECPNNALIELPLADCKKLTNLTCNNNHLTEIQLNNCPDLWNITCHSNQLKTLHLANCPALTTLDCSNNPDLQSYNLPPSLETLDISRCGLTSAKGLEQLSSLGTLICSKNSIKELNLSGLCNLHTLTCNDNLLTELASAKEHTNLMYVNVANNPISSLLLDQASELTYVSVSQTDLDACALDALYKSLRDCNEAENSGMGAFIIDNSTSSAPTSKTSIATKKGWMVMVQGDGSGCTNNAIKAPLTPTPIIRQVENGWIVTNIPASVRQVALYDLSGKLLSLQQTVGESSFKISAPYQGAFLIQVGEHVHKVIYASR